MARIVFRGFKIKAASLVEVLVATVILMLILGISTHIFYGVISSSHNFQKIQAEVLLASTFDQTKKEKRYFDEELESEDFRIEKRVSAYNNQEDLWMIHLKIFNSENKMVGERKDVVLWLNE